MIRLIFRLLCPAPREVLALAERESDPREAASFEAIHVGPVLAFAGLVAIGVLGIVMAPIRLVARILSR